MNIAFLPDEELPLRKLFTADDVMRMVDAGILREDDRVELIEGELVMMAAKKIAHERIKTFLTMALAQAVPESIVVSVEGTIQLADDILVEPDLAVVAKSVYDGPARDFMRPQPTDVLLLVEVAVSSLAYDRQVKARLYARHGIREFWVIDANERATWVHTGPAGDGWTSIVRHGEDETLAPVGLPGFSVRLKDIV